MKISTCLLALAISFGAPALAVAARDDANTQLEKALRGRTPEKPVDCISMSDASSTQIIDGTAILYRVGSTIYVNRPRGGAKSLRKDDILLTRSFGNRLCRPEIVNLIDPASRQVRSFVSLGEFVPYR